MLKGSGLERRSFPELALGWYEESSIWNLVEPSGLSWNIKSKRPFIVVKSTERYVYFILLTSQNRYFPCDKDDTYGIKGRVVEIDLRKCDKRDSPDCEWIENKSYLFKRILNRSCMFVLRISRRFLEENAGVCGLCGESLFDDKLREIIRREMEYWTQESSETW